MFANPGCENDAVEPAKRRRERADFTADPIDEEIDGQTRARIVACLERSHIARNAGNAQQAGLFVEQRFDFACTHFEFVDQIENHAGVERSRARPHR